MLEPPAPAISIVVAAHNIATYIDDCLRSLLVPEARDCEIIVIDDGSTDATPARLASYRDSRLRVVSQANGGLGAARNTGIAEARGRYLLFVDGDDWTSPDLVPRCLAGNQSPSRCRYLCIRLFRCNRGWAET
ncbi:glycosyltransferase family 2 protein [Salinisphaera hydrothermalis]|uniref:glycosyltransferase family 2 protein n=1 Tax=Salinisphaera hydrothermalis TaxID=563188 RepID=UPI00333E1A6B